MHVRCPLLWTGARVGHRSLMRYYKQRFGLSRTVAVAKNKKAVGRVLQQYRALGWTSQTGKWQCWGLGRGGVSRMSSLHTYTGRVCFAFVGFCAVTCLLLSSLSFLTSKQKKLSEVVCVWNPLQLLCKPFSSLACLFVILGDFLRFVGF